MCQVQGSIKIKREYGKNVKTVGLALIWNTISIELEMAVRHIWDFFTSDLTLNRKKFSWKFSNKEIPEFLFKTSTAQLICWLMWMWKCWHFEVFPKFIKITVFSVVNINKNEIIHSKVQSNTWNRLYITLFSARISLWLPDKTNTFLIP